MPRCRERRRGGRPVYYRLLHNECSCSVRPPSRREGARGGRPSQPAPEGQTPSPEDIFHYLYAALYAESHRERYAEFLKIDSPRIPFTADRDVFEGLAALGERLVELHLLKSAELDPPLARFHG